MTSEPFRALILFQPKSILSLNIALFSRFISRVERDFTKCLHFLKGFLKVYVRKHSYFYFDTCLHISILSITFLYFYVGSIDGLGFQPDYS